MKQREKKHLVASQRTKEKGTKTYFPTPSGNRKGLKKNKKAKKKEDWKF